MSKENNCNQQPQTQTLYKLTLVVLVFGYFQLFIYALLIFFLPCFILYVRSRPDNRPGGHLNNQGINQVLQSMAREKFSAETFHHEANCPICFVDYAAEDTVTQLACDPKHYFHTECIEGWVSKGNNSCPLCRKPIREV